MTTPSDEVLESANDYIRHVEEADVAVSGLEHVFAVVNESSERHPGFFGLIHPDAIKANTKVLWQIGKMAVKLIQRSPGDYLSRRRFEKLSKDYGESLEGRARRLVAQAGE